MVGDGDGLPDGDLPLADRAAVAAADGTGRLGRPAVGVGRVGLDRVAVGEGTADEAVADVLGLGLGLGDEGTQKMIRMQV